MASRTTILFVCVGNAGRSQMAAGSARLLAGARIAARSAGSAPAVRVHENVVAAMRRPVVSAAEEESSMRTSRRRMSW